MFCIEHFLKQSKLLVELLRFFLFILIFSVEARSIVWVNVAQVNFVSWLDSEAACVKVLLQCERQSFPDEFLDVHILLFDGNV